MTDDTPLVPEPRRFRQGRVAWFLACLLAATVIWSFAWNPVMGLLLFTMYPPENLNGSFTMGYLVAGVAAFCMLLSLIVTGRAVHDYMRPNYGVLIVILAACAVAFGLIGQELYDAIPVIVVEAP